MQGLGRNGAGGERGFRSVLGERGGEENVQRGAAAQREVRMVVSRVVCRVK